MTSTLIPSDVSQLWLPDGFLTLRRVTHSLAFVSLSAPLLKTINSATNDIIRAASNPQGCHGSVLTLLSKIEAIGGPLASRIRCKLPGDLYKDDDYSCFLFTKNEYGQNMEAAASDLKCTVDMMVRFGALTYTADFSTTSAFCILTLTESAAS